MLGAQGNLWTEYIPTFDHLTYMAFPRAAAMAEVVWSPAECARLRRLPARAGSRSGRASGGDGGEPPARVAAPARRPRPRHRGGRRGVRGSRARSDDPLHARRHDAGARPRLATTGPIPVTTPGTVTAASFGATGRPECPGHRGRRSLDARRAGRARAGPEAAGLPRAPSTASPTSRRSSRPGRRTSTRSSSRGRSPTTTSRFASRAG